MNILTLIQQHPLLRAELAGLGVTWEKIEPIAAQIATQLGGSAEFNLCYVLAALNGQQFIMALDSGKIAQSAGIAPGVADSVIQRIAPWVDRFRLRSF